MVSGPTAGSGGARAGLGSRAFGRIVFGTGPSRRVRAAAELARRLHGSRARAAQACARPGESRPRGVSIPRAGLCSPRPELSGIAPGPVPVAAGVVRVVAATPIGSPAMPNGSRAARVDLAHGFLPPGTRDRKTRARVFPLRGWDSGARRRPPGGGLDHRPRQPGPGGHAAIRVAVSIDPSGQGVVVHANVRDGENTQTYVGSAPVKRQPRGSKACGRPATEWFLPGLAPQHAHDVGNVANVKAKADAEASPEVACTRPPGVGWYEARRRGDP